MAYATVEDLESRWKVLTDAEQATAETLLEDAATYLNALVAVDPEDETQMQILKMVSCSMVQRSMIAQQNDSFGIKQQTISADIYSQSVTYSNPTGDFYLTGSEKRLLGITGSYLASLRPAIDPVKVVHPHDPWRDR